MAGFLAPGKEKHLICHVVFSLVRRGGRRALEMLETTHCALLNTLFHLVPLAFPYFRKGCVSVS